MKKLNLNQDEEAMIADLGKRLKVDLPSEVQYEHVRKVLLKAWKKSDQKLHDWGFSKKQVATLCSRLSGFNRFVMKRPSSIIKALEKANC